MVHACTIVYSSSLLLVEFGLFPVFCCYTNCCSEYIVHIDIFSYFCHGILEDISRSRIARKGQMYAISLNIPIFPFVSYMILNNHQLCMKMLVYLQFNEYSVLSNFWIFTNLIGKK